jgi:hypothetical protein
MPGPDQVAFGKLPKKSDGRTLSLPDLLHGERTSRTDVHNEAFVKQPWGELGNRDRQDCAIAAAGHAEMLWAAKAYMPWPGPSLRQILDAYSKITGYVPDDPTTDKGADLLSVLKYWQKTGIAGQKIGAFAEIIPSEVDTIKWAIDKLDLAYIGLQLPAAWEVPEETCPQPGFATVKQWRKPATWQNPFYGHCVIYTGYSEDGGFTCVSWGKVMTVTEAFHRGYCDEAYAIISPERLSGRVPTANLDAPKLRKTVDRVQSQPTADFLVLERRRKGPVAQQGPADRQAGVRGLLLRARHRNGREVHQGAERVDADGRRADADGDHDDHFGRGRAGDAADQQTHRGHLAEDGEQGGRPGEQETPH